jgi:hypothetical protein
MRFHALILTSALILSIPVLLAAQPVPVGRWDFDNPANLTLATLGNNLVLTGSHQATSGVNASDGAVTIGVGSYYTCTHGINPNGSGSFVNQWSILIDFKVPSLSPWYCFYQTNTANSNDGDCFIRPGSGQIGVGQTGYSSTGIQVNTWYRMVISVNNTTNAYNIYLDGIQILPGSTDGLDGRFSLNSTLLLFADENGEDAAITVSRVAIYDDPLSGAEAAALGTALPVDPNNHAPLVVSQPAGSSTAQAGNSSSYVFEATDQDSDAVSFFIHWGDGSTTGWSSWASILDSFTTSHTYECQGIYPITAQVKDEHGALSAVTSIQSVTVSGSCTPDFLAEPFLQNLKPNGITIMWELAQPIPCTVEYGMSDSYGSSTVATSEDSGYSSYIYKAILTGLEPFTVYHYRVAVTGSVTGDRLFRTGTEEPIDFAFSVWSDSQGTNHGTYPEDPYEPTKAMMRHMRDDPDIHFGTNCGDLAENGSSYTQAHEFYIDRVGKYLGQTKAWFSAWGNHEPGRSAVLRKFADMPSKERTDLINGLPPTPGWGSYSFNYAGCHFIMIDDETSGFDILNWVAGDLQSEANRNARFTFVFIHRPPYCEVWIDGDSFYRNSLVPLMENPVMGAKAQTLLNQEAADARLSKLMEEHKVTACFSGHMHGYERGLQNGVYYCVTGGGSWLDTPEVLVYDWPHMTVGGNHPLAIDVSSLGLGGEYGMINEYVKLKITGNSWLASGVSFRPNGQFYGIIDEFGGTGPAVPTATPTLTLDPTPTSTLAPTATSTPQSTATPTEPASTVEDWRLQP